MSSNSCPTARTGSPNVYEIRTSPAGTRAVEVLSLGAAPVSIAVDVLEADTVRVVVQIRKLVVLDEVVVTAAKTFAQRWLRDFEARRALHIGTFVDSTTVNRRNVLLVSLIASASVRLSRTGSVTLGGCTPRVLVDWRLVESADVRAEFDRLSVKDIAAIEIYEHTAGIPIEFSTGRGYPGCLIAIWTKQMLP